MPEYSRWIVTAATIFMLWAVLMSLVRVWARWSRNMGSAMHDGIFAAAFTLAMAEDVLLYLAVSNGYGKKTASEVSAYSSNALKLHFSSQLLYVASIGLSKCSTAAFIGSLTRDKRQKRVSYLVTAVMAVWTLASVLALAILGDAFEHIADDSEAVATVYQRWLGIEVSGAVLEIVLWTYSITLVWGLSMPLGRRLKVVAVFGGRLLLLPIVAGRLYFLHTATKDPNLYLADIFTQGIINFALMAECALCLKPFLQAFHDEYGLSTGVVGPYSSNPSRDPYAQLSNITDSQMRNTKGSAKTRVTAMRSQDERDVSQGDKRPGHQSINFALRGDTAGLGADAVCTADRDRRSQVVHEAEDDDVELLQMHNGIQRRTTVTVQSESALGP
ncbi:hypothetical protein LTR86_001281 [Recurvomyces mirabilis]|nr:hypothetical protein LTR86_001281 [Recurvomyces mirabilis]